MLPLRPRGEYEWLDNSDTLLTERSRQDIRRFLATAALACAVRPTNAVLWVYMAALLLWRLRQQPRHLVVLLLHAAAVG